MRRNSNITVKLHSGNNGVGQNIPFVSSGCIYFFNAQHLYLKLSPMERCYFDYFAEIMDSENRITKPSNSRSDFLAHLHRIGKKKLPSPKILLRYERKLIDLFLIIPVKDNNQIYYVNPKYVSKVPSAKRKMILQKLDSLAVKGKINSAAILNTPQSSAKSDDQQ